MKILLLSLSLLTSTSVFAEETLEATGFKVIKNTPSMQVLNFQNSIEFKISKERFLTQQSAIQFCKGENSKLDVEFHSLLIAMSGAANFSSFLNESITFKIKDTAGIWQWSKKRDSFTVMFNGGGVVTEEVSVKDLNKVIQLSLPAICVQNL